MVGAMVAMESMNFLGPFGWVAKGGIAGGVIKSLGDAIIAYLESIDHH